MGTPEEYDWGLTPEAVAGIKAGMAISVSVSLDAETAKALAAQEIDSLGCE